MLSDTHGFIHPRVFDFFSQCDEVWHAGDIGSVEAAQKLIEFKPLRAVYGNIDDHHLRAMFSERLVFSVENVKIFMTHIGGYPGNYAHGIKQDLLHNRPKLFVCGHSHILKVMPDPRLNLLHINPGAAGMHGFHQKITLLRFHIDDEKIQEMEILEIDRNKSL